jgi:hypothetical protein
MAALAQRVPFNNVHIFFNGGPRTPEQYKVGSQGALLWRNGTIGETINGDGDDTVNLYSAKAEDLWPGYHPHDLFVPEDDTPDNPDSRPEKHVNLPMYPESQQKIGETLTGIKPPFTTPLALVNQALQGGNFSLLNGYGMSPVELLVTDPLGRRLGDNPATGETFNEIPYGFYAHPASEPAEFHIYLPMTGTYFITVTGTGTGDYKLLALFADSVAVVPLLFERTTIQLGQTRLFSVTVPALSVLVPSPPEVEAGMNISGAIGQPMTFAGSFSDINPHNTHEVGWDFGDGTAGYGTLLPTHSYALPGAFTVTLIITDSDGYVVSDALRVTITASCTLTNLVTLLDDMYARGQISNRGVYESLRQKLNQAQQELDKGKRDKAVQKIRDFIEQVNKETGKHITPEAASALKAQALCVLGALGESITGLQ